MSTTMQQYIDEAEKALLHTYNRYQVVFDKGDGVYLYDMDGRRYLDFVSGIAVFALGYHNEEYNDALKEQIDKIIHTSNYYYNMPAIEAAGSGELATEGRICGGRVSYEIKSTGAGEKSACSIRIGESELSRNRRGLNVVVYNHVTKTVVDSVCFDIMAPAAPASR